MTEPKPISFSEAERLSEIFDSENREEWQRTSHILTTLNLRPDMVIADVGAGTGYFTRLFSERLPEGTVYALDTEPNMLSYMEQRFAGEQQRNIRQGICRLQTPVCRKDWILFFWLMSIALSGNGKPSLAICMSRSAIIR